jgi:predicted Zn-dependent protease with MMP-like domain
VPLGRLLPADPSQVASPPRVVVYRRPLEARASDRGDLGELVHEVVVDQVAQLLGLDPDVVDPPD